jgi:membrane protease YdiL (CAAX protease family)
LKPLFVILAYFAGTILLGAALAPALHWGIHAIEPWALANGLLQFDPMNDQVSTRGLLAFLEADFQKIFDRAVLIAAVVLLWPTVRTLNVRRLADLRLTPDLRARSHFFYGLLTAGGLVAIMAAGYLFFGIYHLKPGLPWVALGRIAVSAIVVATMEEALFRGAILGLFLRSMRPYAALAWTTLIFAGLHFLKPDPDITITHVTWISGFELLPHVFHQFGEPLMLAANLSTLITLGWMLGYVRLRTGSLWMGIGIHAGVVFVKMGFSKLTRRDAEFLPWIGSELQIGIVPVALLLLGLFILWRRLEYEELLPNPKPRS